MLNHHITFVDSNNGSSTAENLYTDDGAVYNPSNNVLAGSGANFVAYYINGAQITSTAAELNVLDGITAATELNYTDGVTSNIQTQLDAKEHSPIRTAGISGWCKCWYYNSWII